MRTKKEVFRQKNLEYYNTLNLHSPKYNLAKFIISIFDILLLENSAHYENFLILPIDFQLHYNTPKSNYLTHN